MATPDAGAGPREQFAERFALLYAEAASPPLKRVAQAVGKARLMDQRGRPVRLSPQRISDWRRGQNVPSGFAALAVVLTTLIEEACRSKPNPTIPGLYDLAVWRALHAQALASPVSVPHPAPEVGPAESVRCPYRGLASFREEDHQFFFGRETSTDMLVERLVAGLTTGGIVALVGASGAGKSSLLRAGLVPALRKGALPAEGSADWPVLVITPGEDPLSQLKERIPELAETSRLTGPSDTRAAIAAHARRCGVPGVRLVLLVDQLEELFTLCDDETQRSAFVQLLHAAGTPEMPGDPPPAIVLVGLRADFYNQCLAFPELAEALQDRHMLLGPMTSAQLRDTVAGPAKSVGLRLEAGLLELLIRDVGIRVGRTRAGEQTTYEAGLLPLLSHALLTTWQHRRSGKLTITGYRAAGGIHGAVEATAERAWAELDSPGRDAARHLLLRLTRIGDDGHDTRRRADKQRLLDQASNRSASQHALETLAGARLVTLDTDGSVQITHEALLRAWPRLRGWIEQNREGLLLAQRLEEDAEAWHSVGGDSSMLYRGARLDAANQWAGTTAPSRLAGDFLTVSTRHRRRRYWTNRAGIALVVVLALVAGATAAFADSQRKDVQFTDIVAEADRLQNVDPSLAAQLNLVAHRMRPDDQNVKGRLLSSQNVALARPLPGHAGGVYSLSFTPDGHILATAGFLNTIQLWDTSDPDQPVPLGPPLNTGTNWLSCAQFSPDGRVLVSGDGAGAVQLWDLADPRHPVPLGRPEDSGHGSVMWQAFSPDGRTLATAHQDGTTQLWAVGTDPGHPLARGEALTGHVGMARAVAFSPDGRTLVTGGADRTVRVWNVSDPAHPLMVGAPLTGHTEAVGAGAIAFSPDGRIVATGGDDKSVRLWSVGPGPAPLGHQLVGSQEQINSVAFSPDGHTLAAGSSDTTVRLWNVTDPVHPLPVGTGLPTANGAVYSTLFSPDGRTLAVGGEDGTTLLYSLPATLLTGHLSAVQSVAFSPNGRTLASGGFDDTVRLWDVTDPAGPIPLGPVESHRNQVINVAFGPSGRLFASLARGEPVQLRDVTDPRHPLPVGTPIPHAARNSSALAFSRDGRLLAISDTDQTVQLWGITDPVHPIRLGPALRIERNYVNSVAFSPDSGTLATGGNDGTMQLWDVRRPTEAVPYGPPNNPHAGQLWEVRFSPDGRTLAAASDDKSIRRWDVSVPARPVELAPLLGHAGLVNNVVFSPDGDTLASTSVDRGIRLWDLTDPTPTSESLIGHTGTVAAVAFSPDGRTLATGSRDNTIMLWDLNLDDAVHRICADSRGALSPRQWQRYLPDLPYDPPC